MNNKFFSKHQLELQKKHGGLRVARALHQNRVHEDLEPHEIDFISTSHFFFIPISFFIESYIAFGIEL